MSQQCQQLLLFVGECLFLFIIMYKRFEVPEGSQPFIVDILSPFCLRKKYISIFYVFQKSFTGGHPLGGVSQFQLHSRITWNIVMTRIRKENWCLSGLKNSSQESRTRSENISSSYRYFQVPCRCCWGSGRHFALDVGHLVGPLNYIAGATPNTDFPAL